MKVSVTAHVLNLGDLFVYSGSGSLHPFSAAAVVMVGALNVGDVHQCAAPPATLDRGDELGRFGFGSTTVVLLGPGDPAFGDCAPETVVRTAAPAITS